ncbi:transposase [Singulisphaera sp. Ch08]|uniref:Transposase n=1 Tax=Singulisphaera sp. Ch08 TaxID=3120278 RepID=A0AAU7CQ40_9BACT
MDTVQTIVCKLTPTPEQRVEIDATLKAFALACDFAAESARSLGFTNKVKVQHACYREIRETFGLSSNLAIRAIARACAALKVSAKMHSAFAPASIDYDARIFSFHEWNWTFGLTLLSGRVKLTTKLGERQNAALKGRKPTSAVLVKRRDGAYFLHVQLTDEAPESIETKGTIGVDMGVKNLATTDDGENFSGADVDACRRKYSQARKTCQRKGTKSAKRKLKKISKREARFRANENHVISKRIVAKAKDTASAIAVEDLGGIGQRTTARKADRSRMKGWAFYQLRQFIAYKALAEGIPVIPVDPRNTSRTCSECGHCEMANRKSRDEFVCKHCGFELAADWNAARNIRDRGKVMCPNVGVVDTGGRIPVETTGKPVLASPRL